LRDLDMQTEEAFQKLKLYICSDISIAIATYIYVEAVSKGIADRQLKCLEQVLEPGEGSRKEFYFILEDLHSRGYFSREENLNELKQVISECMRNLNIAKESRERINSLNNYQKELLEYSALYIAKLMERQPVETIDTDRLVGFVSVMLARDVDKQYLLRLFKRALLGVSCDNDKILLLPHAVELLKELAKAVGYVPPGYYIIRDKLNNKKPGEIAFLLLKALNGDLEFYEAVYGYESYKDAFSSVIKGIWYRGYMNEFITSIGDPLRNNTIKVIKDLAQDICEDIVKKIVRYLYAKFEVNLNKMEFRDDAFCCIYEAKKRNTVMPEISVRIYVMPFAFRPPSVKSGERAVIVVNGPAPHLDGYIEYLRKRRSNLANALWVSVHEGLIKVHGPIEEAWQSEIAELLSQETKPKVRLDKTIKTKEELEYIVAEVLKSLGFKVETNTYKNAIYRPSPIEVDVWAEKTLGDPKDVQSIRFTVYVSCKNWAATSVRRSVIDEELGRISNLEVIPTLKVLIVRNISSSVKEYAERNGFLVIDLRDKVVDYTSGHLDWQKTYEYIRSVFLKLFSSTT